MKGAILLLPPYVFMAWTTKSFATPLTVTCSFKYSYITPTPDDLYPEDVSRSLVREVDVASQKICLVLLL